VAGQWFKFNPDDYDRDTGHLSCLEHGAYLLLIKSYMQLRGPLQDHDRALAVLARCSAEEWSEVGPTVRDFFEAKDGRLHHKRCDAELAEQDAQRERWTESGRHAAKARWNGAAPGNDAVDVLIATFDRVSKEVWGKRVRSQRRDDDAKWAGEFLRQGLGDGEGLFREHQERRQAAGKEPIRGLKYFRAIVEEKVGGGGKGRSGTTQDGRRRRRYPKETQQARDKGGRGGP